MKEFSITSNDAEQRLDKFLKKLFVNATRGLLYKLNRKGKIKVIIQWKKTKQDNEYKLQLDDKVQVFLQNQDIKELMQKKEKSQSISFHARLSQKDIIFEDNTLLVVNKNPWQNVHPWDHKTQEVSLIEQAQDYLGEGFASLTFKPSLIHRIDRDTSGIVLIAKEKQVLVQLSADFKEKNTIKKTYYGLVVWKLSRKQGTIQKKLKRIENAKNENKIQVSQWWQEAITHYTLLWEYRLSLPQGEQIISEVEMTIETGRMHQIRVHMAAIWSPILWDNTYGNKSLNHYFSKNFWIHRQMLHAWKIDFFHPKKKKRIQFKAPLKKDMREFTKIMKQ